MDRRGLNATLRGMLVVVLVAATAVTSARPATAEPFVGSTPQSVFYDFDVAASTESGAIRTFQRFPSVNAWGEVAFGAFTSGPTVMVAGRTLTPRDVSTVTPNFNRNYSPWLQINDAHQVITQFTHELGSEILSIVRPLDGVGRNTFADVAIGRESYSLVRPPDFRNVHDDVAMNNRGQVAFTGFVSIGDSFKYFGRCMLSCLVTGTVGGGELNIRSGDFTRPAIADNGTLAVTESDWFGANKTVKRCTFDLSACESIAGPDNGFTEIEAATVGISDDGSAIAFMGDRGEGLGIFVDLGLSTGPITIAGENLPDLGLDRNGHAIRFDELFLSRLSVIRTELGAGGLADDSYTVAFMATPSAPSRLNPITNDPLLFSARPGIWTSRIDLEPRPGTGELVADKRSPVRVVQIGDDLEGRTVRELSLHDALAPAAGDPLGTVRTQRRGDHYVTFWADTDAGELIVRGTHVDSDLDGLLDHWERSGIQTNARVPGAFLNLRAMGAERLHRDIFLEIDWVSPETNPVNPFHRNEPPPGTIEALVDMFATAPPLEGNAFGTRIDGTDPAGIPAGITLHVDAGSRLSVNMGSGPRAGGEPISDPSSGGHIDVVHRGAPGDLDIAGVRTRSFDEIKDVHFGNTDGRGREFAFHYAMLADFHDAVHDPATVRPFQSQIVDAQNFVEDGREFGSLLTDTDLPPDAVGDALIVLGGPGQGQVRSIAHVRGNFADLRNAWTVVPEPGTHFALLDGSFGVGEHFENDPGNDLIVSLRGFGVSRGGWLANQWLHTRALAHELGHNLGLRHCGSTRTGCDAVSYRSVMSEAHSLDRDSTVVGYAGAGDPVHDDWSNLEMQLYGEILHLGTFTFGSEGQTVADYIALSGGPPDLEGPTVTVQAPAPGRTVAVGEDLSVRLTAVDQHEVTRVEVSLDADGDGAAETLTATAVGSGAYEASFAGISGPIGRRTLSVVARDRDGNVNVPAATVTIEVPNTPPVAHADAYTVRGDDVLGVPATGVLENDTDPHTDALTASLVTPPSNGTLFLNPHGSFTYLPAAGFVGTDSFTYRAADGALTSAAATATITVEPPTGLATILRTPRLYPSTVYPVGTDPSSVVTVDLNGDGLLDVVNADMSRPSALAGDLSVLLNLGEGVMAAEARYLVGRPPRDLRVLDVNGDGVLDLVTEGANSIDTSALSVLLGNGDGTFQAERRTALNVKNLTSADAVELADVNGDRRLDIIALQDWVSPYTVDIYVGNGDGTFQAARRTTVPSEPGGLAVADFDGDGRADVATTHHAQAVLAVHRGNGDGTLQAPATAPYRDDLRPAEIHAVDLNGDAATDLLVADGERSLDSMDVFSTHVGHGDGTFGAGQAFDMGGYDSRTATTDARADLNGDGVTDLVTVAVRAHLTATTRGTAARVRLGNGDGTFQTLQTHPLTAASNTIALVLTDVDADRDADLAVHSTAVSVLRNRGTGAFDPPEVYRPGGSLSPHGTRDQLAAADLDSDGLVDLAMSSGARSGGAGGSGQHSVIVLFGQAGGTFFDSMQSPATTTYPSSNNWADLALADFDGDGVLDAASSHRDPYVSVLFGNGDGTYGNERTVATSIDDVNTLTAADVNGDGRADLVASSTWTSDLVSVVLGNGDGTFQAPQTAAVGRTFAVGRGVGVADLDRDGARDVVVTNQDSDSLSILRGNGDGTLQPERRVAVGDGPQALALADVNRDGVADLTVANQYAGTLSLLLGDGAGGFVVRPVLPTVPAPGAVTAADLNADGRADLVAVGTSGRQQVGVRLGNGDGTFQAERRFFTGQVFAAALQTSVSVGDLDEDGILDLVTTNHPPGNVSVHIGNGDGTFQGFQQFAVAPLSHFYETAVAEVTGDCHPDIVVASMSSSGSISVSGTPSVVVLPHLPVPCGPGGTAPVAQAGGPYATAEGQAVRLDASGSTDADGTIAAVEWDLDGDGEFDDASGVRVDRVFADDASAVVKVRVTDDDGLTDTNAALVEAHNAPPVVQAGAGAPVPEGAVVRRAAGFTDPGAADTHTATIDWGDGSTVESGRAQGGVVEGEHVYADDDVYQLTVCVTDDDGGRDCDAGPVTVTNAAPVVDAGADRTTMRGIDVGVGAPFTDAGVRDTHTATIDWGDGTLADATLAQGRGEGLVKGRHAYAAAGTYTVTVCVRDGDGGRGCDAFEVAVQTPPAPAPPNVRAAEASRLVAGEPAQFFYWFTDPNVSDTHTVVVDWGDGSSRQAVSFVDRDGFGLGSPVHVYDRPGTYTVVVTVCDPVFCRAASVASTVGGGEPTVDAGADRVVVEGSNVDLLATFTDPDSGDTHTATIDWGDGTSSGGTVAQQTRSVRGSHVYGDNGAFAVEVCVNDSGGLEGCDTTTVSVQNRAPGVSLDLLAARDVNGRRVFLGRAGEAHEHRANATDPGSDDLTFDWGAGATPRTYLNGTGPDGLPSPGGTFPFAAADTATLTFAAAGVYEVRVTVTDDDGGSASASGTKLVAGTASCTRTQGFWRQQFSDAGTEHIPPGVRQAYLDVVGAASAVFSERVAAATPGDARAVLSPRASGGMRAQAQSQALAAWLNFAHGSVGWDDQITPQLRYGELMAEVESVLLDPNASHADLEGAKDLAESVNVRDAADEACES